MGRRDGRLGLKERSAQADDRPVPGRYQAGAGGVGRIISHSLTRVSAMQRSLVAQQADAAKAAQGIIVLLSR